MTEKPARPPSAALYFVISLLLLPVTAAGYVLWIAKALAAGRGSGVSGTAQGPLYARWLAHQLGLRPDEPAARLLPVLPGISLLAVRLVSGPTRLAYRLSGYLPRTFRYPYEGAVSMADEAAARQTFFDGVVARHLPGRRQFVILGAGFDTRAFRLPPGGAVRAFEVDTPATQASKRAMLQQAGLDLARVTLVPADFEKDDWLTRLAAAGFDPAQPALFIWEGVVMYLDRAAAEATLRQIAGLAAGTRVAFDFITTEPLESNGLYWRYARAGTRAAGEPLKFGIDGTPPAGQRLAEWLRGCGLALSEQQIFGPDTAAHRAWGGFAVAEVA